MKKGKEIEVQGHLRVQITVLTLHPVPWKKYGYEVVQKISRKIRKNSEASDSGLHLALFGRVMSWLRDDTNKRMVISH